MFYSSIILSSPVCLISIASYSSCSLPDIQQFPLNFHHVASLPDLATIGICVVYPSLGTELLDTVWVAVVVCVGVGWSGEMAQKERKRIRWTVEREHDLTISPFSPACLCLSVSVCEGERQRISLWEKNNNFLLCSKWCWQSSHCKRRCVCLCVRMAAIRMHSFGYSHKHNQ